MNPYAYRTTGLAIKALSRLLKARVRIHGAANIPSGSLIFVINHFTRIETLLMPYHIHEIIRHPVWSLADYKLFKGALGTFLDNVGAVSTKDPDRDRLIIKSLLTGEATWIVFPEGRMVKSRKIFEKGQFVVAHPNGLRRPRSGAAALALRTEFYRSRLSHLASTAPREAERLLGLFRLDTVDQVRRRETFIVPVNITYFPLRARENILSGLASRFVDGIPDKIVEEIMTEGTMLLSGVDIDVRFGPPIGVKRYLKAPVVQQDIQRPEPFDFDDPIPSVPTMRKAALNLMDRYMAAIYGMTTVNCDHLFSSLLRTMPRRIIDETVFRRKVFAIGARDLERQGVWVHESLEGGPLHLITDDGFGYYRDFMKVAAEKRVVHQNGPFLIKERSTLLSSFDLHRVRLENPISVMANEVAPLKQLQKLIRRESWRPDFWTRRNIAALLMGQADREFESDYDANHIAGESKPRSIGRPFLVEGRSRKFGILLIHGYMAAPAEVRNLALYLADLGYWVCAPRLRGHGTSPEDLATRTHTDWVASVDRGYAIISSICRKVVVGGFSTGAGLSLDLASRIPSIRGVFAISPPLRLQHMSAKYVPAVDTWNRLMKKISWNGAMKEFVENRPENPHINYLRNPVAGVHEIERMMDALEKRLSNVTVPALVAQAERDPVVDPKGSQRLYDLIGSEQKQYVLFNFDRHGILLGNGAEVVYDAIGRFLASVVKC